MNPDDPPEPHLHAVGDAELEARIVAWVLGEASAFESAELERLCEKSPELERFREEIQAVHELVRDDYRPPVSESPRLPEAKREKIIALLGEEPATALATQSSDKKVIHYFTRRGLLMTAACIGLSAAAWPILFPSHFVRESKAVVAAKSAFASPASLRAEAEPKPAAKQASQLDPEIQVIGGLFGAKAQERSVDGPPADRPAIEPSGVPQQQLESLASARGNLSDEGKKTLGANQPQEKNGADSPPAIQVGPISIAGNTKSRGEVIRREVPNSASQPDLNSIEELERSRSGIAYKDSAAARQEETRSQVAQESGGSRNLGLAQDSVSPSGAVGGGSGGGLGRAVGGRASGETVKLEKNEVGFGYVEAVRDSDQKRDEARDAYAKGDYSQAVDKTRESLQNLPDAPAVQDRRAYLTQQLADASNALGERYRRAGRYAEARELADSVLAKDPNDARAKGILSELDDPIRTNPALTSGNTENVDKVSHGLYTAEGAYNLGKYEDAKRGYEDVLRIDPYNTAARRGMEQVAQARAEYYRAAYDQTRAEMLVPGSQIQPDSADNGNRTKLLAQVDAAWEIAQPPLPKIEGLFGITQGADSKGSSEENELSLGGAPKRKAGQLALGYGFGESLSYQALQDLEDHFSLAGQEMRIAREPRSFFYDSTEPALFGRRNVDAVLNAPESNFFRMPYTDENGIQHLPQSLANAPASPSAPPPAVESPVKAEESVSPALKEISAAAEAYSTFSLHVSDVSFRLAKAALDRGERPAPESIREEEFYNAVDYGDPAAGQQPVACVVEQSAHPVRPQRNLVRIGVRTGSSGRAAAMPLNLVLLLDSSGSMEREDRHTSLLKAVQALSTLLKDGDTVSVVGFSRKPRLLVDRLSGAEASKLNSIIADSPVEGGTDLAQGLKLAGELAARQFQANGQNRVVLFTDGAANLGDADPDSLTAQIGRFRDAGIAFDAAGFGAEGLNDKLIEQLTRHGNGRYYVVNRPEDADAGFARQLAGAFRPAAEDVKVQVRFNPSRVGHYRLAGFAEHRLKKEDFHNDSVDAAEMAAEEAGNALYEIEPLAGGEGEIGEVSVRFRNVATGQMVEQSWTIPWQEQAPAFDKAKPSLQLAGLALMTAEKLQGGPAGEAVDFNTMSAVIANVRQACGASPGVPQLLEMIGKLR